MIRPEKDDLIAHAEELGAEVVLSHPATVSESFLAGMSGLGKDNIVLIGFPDTIWEPGRRLRSSRRCDSQRR